MNKTTCLINMFRKMKIQKKGCISICLVVFAAMLPFWKYFKRCCIQEKPALAISSVNLDTTMKIYLGRAFVDNGFTKENMNVPLEGWDDCGILWTSWKHAGYLCQVDATLVIFPDKHFEIELRMENIGNNPYYIVSPIRNEEYSQIVITNGLQSFLHKSKNTIAILPTIFPNICLPDYQLRDENGVIISLDSGVRLIPKYDCGTEFYIQFEKTIGAKLTKAYHCADKESPPLSSSRLAFLTILHPDFQIEKIKDWENLLVMLWIEPCFCHGPFVAPSSIEQGKMVFCIPDFCKKYNNVFEKLE